MPKEAQHSNRHNQHEECPFEVVDPTIGLPSQGLIACNVNNVCANPTHDYSSELFSSIDLEGQTDANQTIKAVDTSLELKEAQTFR